MLPYDGLPAPQESSIGSAMILFYEKACEGIKLEIERQKPLRKGHSRFIFKMYRSVFSWIINDELTIANAV